MGDIISTLNSKMVILYATPNNGCTVVKNGYAYNKGMWSHIIYIYLQVFFIITIMWTMVANETMGLFTVRIFGPFLGHF
jgi:hypothetical protein